MRVLHVVHRVVLRLLARERQVEIERRVVAALEHEEPRRVDADVVDQVVERDDLPLPLRHLDALAALDEVHKLHDQELERVGLASECAPRGLHPRHVSVVVRAPEVDEPIEPAPLLVEVVRDVGGEVRVLAV